MVIHMDDDWEFFISPHLVFLHPLGLPLVDYLLGVGCLLLLQPPVLLRLCFQLWVTVHLKVANSY